MLSQGFFIYDYLNAEARSFVYGSIILRSKYTTLEIYEISYPLKNRGVGVVTLWFSEAAHELPSGDLGGEVARQL
jgi:hypothetical protein